MRKMFAFDIITNIFKHTQKDSKNCLTCSRSIKTCMEIVKHKIYNSDFIRSDEKEHIIREMNKKGKQMHFCFIS